MLSFCMNLALLSTLHYGTSLKVEPVADQGKSPALEAQDSVDKQKAGSSLVNGGMASLASAANKIPEAKLDSVASFNEVNKIPEAKLDSVASFNEGEKISATAKVHKSSVPAIPTEESDIAAQSTSQTAATKVNAKKQIARGRSMQPDADAFEPPKSFWIVWFQQIPQQPWMKGIGLVLFLVLGLVVGVRSFSMLQSQCNSKDDSVLEEAWKPKQVTLTSEVTETMTALANETMASVNAAIDVAAKLAEGQPEDSAKEKPPPRVAPRYSRRHVSCPWPKEPELPAQHEKAQDPELPAQRESSQDGTQTTPEQSACLLLGAPTVAKVQLDDELGAWIPDLKDVAAELGDSMSHEDSTSAGDSEQALLDKLREVASDGEDESISPRHLRRCASEENLEEI